MKQYKLVCTSYLKGSNHEEICLFISGTLWKNIILLWKDMISSINMKGLGLRWYTLYWYAWNDMAWLVWIKRIILTNTIILKISILSWTLRVLSSWVQHVDRGDFFVSQKPIQYALLHVRANRVFRKSVFYLSRSFL